MQFTHEPEDAARFMGPGSVDALLRQTINQCWITLPQDKKNVAAVQAEVRRLMERALRDLEEDATAFGVE